jgi:hypothetical protein
MQIADGKGFGKMIKDAQSKLPEGHQWIEKKSVSKDGLRVWNTAKEKGYTEAVDDKGNIITKEVTLNKATKESITGKSSDYNDVIVDPSEADNIIKELQEIYPGIEARTDKQGAAKVKIKIKLPVLENKTKQVTEDIEGDVADITEEAIEKTTEEITDDLDFKDHTEKESFEDYMKKVVVEPTQQTSEVKSENISSKGSEFAKKLTNPGNNLKVTYKGREFRNAEHAYQTYKSGEFDQKAYDSNAFKPVGSKPANRDTNYQTMS